MTLIPIPRQVLLFGLCLALVGCSEKGAAPKEEAEKKETETAKTQNVRFLIQINGIIDQALLDGRLPALTFDAQKPSDFVVSSLTSLAGENSPALKPGTFAQYTFRGNVARMQFRDAGILFENPVVATTQFKLSNIRHLGRVALTGKTATLRMNGAPFHLFSASLDGSWRGKADNQAGPENPEIDISGIDPTRNQKDLEALQGVWECLSMQTGLEKSRSGPTLTFRKMEFEMAGAIFLQNKIDAQSNVFSFVLDPSKNPKQIDIWNAKSKKSAPYLGIYQIESKELKLCIAAYSNAPRPKVFSADAKVNANRVVSYMIFSKHE
jgi:uncharacterized protein (TIGR03067 family)